MKWERFVKGSQWLLHLVLRLPILYFAKLQYSAACFLTFHIAVSKLLVHNMFQGLCTELLVAEVVHHESFFPTRAASKHPTAATVTANRTMNFLCTNLLMWISRRAIQKEPNSNNGFWKLL